MKNNIKDNILIALYSLLCVIVGSLYDIWGSLHPFVVYAVVILIILPLFKK